CESGDGRPAAGGEGAPELAVLGPEVVPPRRDAVRLVDDEARHPKLSEPVQEAGPGEALRRHVEQAEAARDGGLEAGHLLGALLGRVDEGGADAGAAEAVDLVLHEGDEGRDEQRQAVRQHRRHPVADALAGAGRGDGQDVPARQLRLDDRCLAWPEVLQAEHLAQHLQSAVEHGLECGGSERPGGTLYRATLGLCSRSGSPASSSSSWRRPSSRCSSRSCPCPTRACWHWWAWPPARCSATARC